MKWLGVLIMLYGAVALFSPFLGYRFPMNDWMRQWGLLGEWIVPAIIFIAGSVVYGVGSQTGQRR